MKGLHDNDSSEPVLEGRASGLFTSLRGQHDAHGGLCRDDLGARHVLRQRQTLLSTRRHRNKQNGSTPRRRIYRLRNEVRQS